MSHWWKSEHTSLYGMGSNNIDLDFKNERECRRKLKVVKQPQTKFPKMHYHTLKTTKLNSRFYNRISFKNPFKNNSIHVTLAELVFGSQGHLFETLILKIGNWKATIILIRFFEDYFNCILLVVVPSLRSRCSVTLYFLSTNWHNI